MILIIPSYPLIRKCRLLVADQYIEGRTCYITSPLYPFLAKVLYDMGMISNKEPISTLTQGMVLKDGDKMSKLKGMWCSEEIIENYGVDTARMFIPFAAPPERIWREREGSGGLFRFNRVWRLVYELKDDIVLDAVVPQNSFERGDGFDFSFTIPLKGIRRYRRTI